MISNKAHNQGVLFSSPFDQDLDPSNRWVKFSNLIPWDKLSSYYLRRMDPRMGASIKDARLILGALIIKHHEDLSDEGTIEAIRENLYMQYFVGLTSFMQSAVFAPSLFVEIRKRLGLDYWQQINELIVEHNKPVKAKEHKDQGNSGTINIDATIVEQDIKYPTDLNLLNESREKLEELIGVICSKTSQPKPRTYRINARKSYLNTAKKKKNSRKAIRRAIGAQLNFVKRDLRHIDGLLGDHVDLSTILNSYELKYLHVVNELYRQQRYMHGNRIHSIAHRIVSIHQPHVRPMVRGKAGSDVEFGSKIGVSIHNGLCFLDNLSWESYNENEDLITSAENYKGRNGYYPAKINADQIYITRNNRSWCKERNIQLNGKPLGRPTAQTKERLKELKVSVAERNAVEGKFGQAKRWYGMANIKAKLKPTSESMIGAIVVVLNLVRLVQLHALTFVNTLIESVINYFILTCANLFFPRIRKLTF